MNLVRTLFRLILGRRLPVVRGDLAVAGLGADAVIRRDRWGIPAIEAGSPRDAAFAIGFCHGQDRGFQLEILQRVCHGTVAEMAGAVALPVDRLSRRIGFRRAAMEQLALIDADVREQLDGYAAGVDAGRSVGCPRLPHEFALLGIKPTPWHASDTLAMAKLMSFTLSANWDAELVRLKVLLEDGPEALAAVTATYADWQPVITPPGAAAGRAADRLAADIRAFLEYARPGTGSNNWAVAPSRTRTGRPILANDPHLDARLPSHWYLASIRCPQWVAVGATLMGGYAVLAGHNGHAAWGLTAGLVDNTDLFLEEIGPDGASVREGDGWQACQVLEETIAVKGASPVTERVLVTPRGPLVGPSLHGDHAAISLCATWLRPARVRGFYALPDVRSFAEFREAFRYWPIAAQNVAYADATGTIGWQLVGDAPIRKKGFGTLPLHGADPEVGWEPHGVPYEDIPHLQNPECGWLASANNRHQPEGQGPYLGGDFTDGYRVQAIGQALAARGNWDVASTMALQMDRSTPAWPELREAALSVEGEGAEILRDWDGVLSPDSVAASVYELWLASLVRRVAQARAPRSWAWVVGKGLTPLTPYNFGCYRRTANLVNLLRGDAVMAQSIRDAMEESLSTLRKRFGNDRSRWAWGRIRTLTMRHPLARSGGVMGWLLKAVFDLGPFPAGGDADVINQAAVLPLDPLSPAENVPSMRMVVDVGDWRNSRWVLPAGQSGNPLSPHYSDLLPLWLKGEGVPIALTADEAQAACVAELRLMAE